jgi:outer membrane biosynthesis protein TonB
MPQSSPPPSSTAPPPRSGGGIYILAVVLLILGIGGLVVWKLKGGGETNTTPPVPTPIQTNQNTFVEPPPPPPPVVEEQTHADGGARVVSNNNGACAATKCTGTANTAINSALAARAGAARPCYERALRVNSALQGKLMVNVRIDPQGNVCNASVLEDAIHSVEVSNCVMGMFRSAKFPPPTGGCVDARVPLSFVPREGK